MQVKSHTTLDTCFHPLAHESRPHCEKSYDLKISVFREKCRLASIPSCLWYVSPVHPCTSALGHLLIPSILAVKCENQE